MNDTTAAHEAATIEALWLSKGAVVQPTIF